ncbi:hypothetical protein SteCoe_13331 [Stentor coeruleus]|uniref:Uncharacterized protein n=1 Tax=Stentor coeruleus TaxID=5963 RepID=A0A1R2C8L5_9CILI|nr:hypothetical protein SteCoe_13331 [Stentor coeruleus]
MAQVEDSSKNHFLIEIDRNSDIGSDIRREIEHRFNCSITNKNYRFPRSSKSSHLVIKTKKKPCLHQSEKQKNKVNILSSLYLKKQSPLKKLPIIKSSCMLKSYEKTMKIFKNPKDKISVSNNISICNTSLLLSPQNAIFKSRTCSKGIRLPEI